MSNENLTTIWHNNRKRVGRATAVFLFLALFGLLMGSGAGTAVAQPVEFTVWNFDAGDTMPSVDLTGNAVASSGTGLGGESFPTGYPGLAWSFDNWALGSLDANKYFGFAVDLTNYGGIGISFTERRSATGIRDFVIHYSLDDVTYTEIPTTITNVPDNTSSRNQSFDLGSGTDIDLAIRGQSTVYFRIYGYNAEGTGGTWRIDHVTFTAATNPTAVTLSSFSPSNTNLPLLLLVVFGLLVGGTAVVAHRRKA